MELGGLSPDDRIQPERKRTSSATQAATRTISRMFIRRASRTLLAAIVALPLLVPGVADAAVRTGCPTADRPQPLRQLLHYNHGYGVVDVETATAIEESAYLREFANFEVRTTTGADGVTWTGRYLLGRMTYLEMFGIGDLPGQDGSLGSTGVALSTECAGDLAKVTERLHDLGVTDPDEFTQTRDFGDGVPVPWFDAMYTTDQYDRFGAWAMEYRTEYFADPRSKTEPPNHPGDVGRERYLSDAYRDHHLRDITSIRLAVTAQDLAKTVPMLRAGRFTVIQVPGRGVIAVGGTTTIRLDVVPLEQVGLRRVEMSLNRPVPYRHEERIGNSTLVVGPLRAVWTFPAP